MFIFSLKNIFFLLLKILRKEDSRILLMEIVLPSFY